jgi:MFS family permease
MKRPGRLEYLALNSYWFGLTFLWNGMHSIILPATLLHVVPEARKSTYLGVLTFAGLLLAMLMQPLSGALSDQIGASWGRRRPWMVVGAIGSFFALLVLGAAPTYAWIFVGYTLLQLCSNIAHGPFQGLIPDLVPPERLGVAAGVKNLLDIGGLLAGVLAAGYFVDRGQTHLALAIIVAVMCITLLATLFGVREAPAQRAPIVSTWRHVRSVARHIYFLDCRRYPAYAWLLASRFLVLFGIYAIQGFAQYFIRDVLQSPNPAGATSHVMAVIGAGTAMLVYPAGLAADRLNKKAINIGAALLCGMGALLLLTVHNFAQLMVVGAVLGCGLGAFLSVNWALATYLAPTGEAGRYLGLSNLATAGAAALSRLTGPLIDHVNARGQNGGYTMLFIVAGCSILLGAWVLWRNVPAPTAYRPVS